MTRAGRLGICRKNAAPLFTWSWVWGMLVVHIHTAAAEPPSNGASRALRMAGAAGAAAATSTSVGPTSAGVPAANGKNGQAPAPSQGTLVLAGGAIGFDQQDVWRRFVRSATEYAAARAGVNGSRPRIAVFATASSVPQETGQRLAAVLEEFGASAFLVPVAMEGLSRDHRQAVIDPRIVAQVASAHGVFFSGGQQARLVAALRTADGRPTPVLTAVKRVYAQGGVGGGTSAGAAVMSRVMCRDASDLLKVLRHGVTKGREVDDGFGLLDHRWFVDQHFLARGRIARALVIMQQFGPRYGLGIDEGTAVIVRNGQGEVIGRGGALLMDLSKATQDTRAQGFNLTDARISYLDGGDRLDLTTLRVSPAASKLTQERIDPASAAFRPAGNERIIADDILAKGALVDVMRRVMDNRPSEALGLTRDGAAANGGTTQGFEFRISRTSETLAWRAGQAATAKWTIAGMRIDVQPRAIRVPLMAVARPR